jgi:inward rectifier potassium channel
MEEIRDLGFGSRVAQESRVRFLNRDGTFNVTRRGIPFLRRLNLYHTLLNISWPRFMALIVALYFLINLGFAGLYCLCGTAALRGMAEMPMPRLLDDFFFSVQTFSTVGYGGLTPVTFAANLVVTLEELAALLFFATATGLIFARFARPVARILFSRQAVIAPYHGLTAFEFRLINTHSNQIVNLEATVVFSHLVVREGGPVRVFDELPLERPRVTFFPLQWTVVHPIDGRSPLAGLGHRDLAEADAEFIVLLNGFDETFSQTVHTRTSYKPREIVVGARFADMFIESPDGRVSVDVRRLHDLEETATPFIRTA